MNVINVNFTKEFRVMVSKCIKEKGLFWAEEIMKKNNHPSFVKVIIKDILKKEGW